MTRPAHALVLGLTLCLLAPAGIASTLENRGSPEPNVATMTTYGVDVATRTGLKTVIPAGWQLYVHKSVTLPETMSWKLGDAWPAVLTEFAVRNQVAVLIDWERRVVMMRSVEQALEENAKRDEIQQAATTPLPKFRDATTRAEQAKAAARAEAEQRKKEAEAAQLAAAQRAADERTRLAQTQDRLAAEELARVPVIRTNPTPAMVASQSEAARRSPAPKYASTQEFRYTGPISLNRPNVRTVAQAIANRFNLRLVYAAPEQLALKGPVTLLAESPEQDALLLQKAVGAYGPVVLEVSIPEKVLRVLPRGLSGEALAAARARGVDAHKELLAAADAQSEGASAPETTASSKEPVAIARPQLAMTLREREPLEDALVRFTRAQGYTLEWKVSGGFEANRTMNFTGHTVAEVLSQVLPKLGLSADIYTRDKHIIVRPGDAARDR